ncbi:MAG: ATP-binding protein [candidate division Zixibacteria bacterium]|nr:ATP-binding protein [candidate division Zixibacteria bacterium]
MEKLKIINYKGWQTLVSSELGVKPIFQRHIRWRTNNKLATNVCITGEPGIGKSYLAIDIARVFEGLYKSKPEGKLKERFTVEQIVFTHSEYMRLLIHLKMGKAIVFDEPSYAMGKRNWFKDLQKVLVQTLESQRFLIHPLFIPIINMSLLDKTIRSYLIQFQIHVVGRGHAWVYRLSPSQATEKVYRQFMCELFYHQFDSNLCDRDSCLGCKKLDTCQIFRAKYERKKRSTQFERYEQAKDQAIRKESQELTDKQIEEMVMQNVDNLKTSKGKLHVSKMRLYLRNEFDVYLSIWKSYNIKGLIEAAYPEKFEET